MTLRAALRATSIGCVLLLLLLRSFFWSTSQRPLDSGIDEDACALAHQLDSMPTPSTQRQGPKDEVRLFWWYRFGGTRRSAHHPERLICPAGLQCVSDSRPSAFSSAHAVIVMGGPGLPPACLPPERSQHAWMLEFSESPTIYTRLLDSDFMRRFGLKMSHELDSDVVLTALHPLVEGGNIPPNQWLRQTAAAATLQRSALVWIASYCPAASRRAELVRRLQHALPPSLPLLSIGKCMRNHNEPLLQDKQSDGGGNASTWWSKVRALSWYRFCLIAENSIARDYVTGANEIGFKPFP